MRLGVAWDSNSNAYYRAVFPLQAMAQRGHDVVWQQTPDTAAHLRNLAGCDVVHVYRRCDPESRRAVSQLTRAGTPVTYDNDDDLSALPRESDRYKARGGLKGERIFLQTVQVARMARWVSTTNETLAAKYRKAGVECVEVIENCLPLDISDRGRATHSGIVIGWIAAEEHRADAARIGIADALTRLLAKHRDVRVECIGVDLALPERYRRDANVDFLELPARIAGFDIGIAPLADIPYNRTRSDIKVKEYAASGVPWLASPVGPYAGLGPEEGGRLVPDDGWFEALDELVTSRRARKRLGKNARKWACRQTVASIADRLEHLFGRAAGLTADGGSSYGNA